MKKYIGLIIGCLLPLLPAAEAGKPQGKLQVAKWYSKSPLPQQQLECTVLFDVSGANAPEMLRMLESLQEEFQIPIQAVAVSARQQVDSFVAATGPYRIGLAADDHLKTRNSLAENESLFPYSVLSKDGTVLWSGDPTELDMVIEQVKENRFSLHRQKRVEALRKELQMAIQSGLPHVVSSTADKILKESPSDRIAIQAKIMALSAAGKSAGVTAFIRETCRKNPQDLRLRIMQWELLLREGSHAEFVRAVEAFSRDFPGPDPRIVRPVAYIVENAPYGTLPPDLAMSLAQRAYDSVKNNPKNLTCAIACETLARVHAEHGQFSEAVKLQQTALPFRLKTPQENAAKDRLQYYRILLKKSAGRK